MVDRLPEVGIVFIQARLYLHQGRRPRLLRFITMDEETQVLLFKVVSLKWDWTPTAVEEMSLSDGLKLKKQDLLCAYGEEVRPGFMNWPDDDLLNKFKGSRKGIDALKNEKWLAQRDAEDSIIKALVTPEAMSLTYGRETQAAILRAHAEGDELLIQQIKRLLHRYAWFGLEKNALLRLESAKGYMPTLVRQFSSKTGRPNAAVKLGLGGRYEGHNATKADIARFIVALELYYVGRDVSLKKTYALMQQHLCMQKTKTADGVNVFYPIASSKLPTFDAFKKRAPTLIRLLKMRAAKEGAKDGKAYEERRGYDSDIAPRAGDVFDIDATPFNKEAVTQLELEGEMLNIGKVTVLIVRDRATGKAVGWHCYTGFENWEEGYRLAIFCALTSKKQQLAWLEIDAPDAWHDDENIKPLGIFFDNGAGASNYACEAYRRLDLRFFPAAPNNPQQKGGVEAIIGRAQDAQSTTPGGYRRTTRERDRQAKRLAKLFACESQWDIERQLVLDLIEQNAARNKPHLLTHKMRIDGVHGSSNDMFSWWVRKMGGVQMRRLSESEVYRELLNHKECKVTLDGVRFNGARYKSEALSRLRTLTAGALKVMVMFHPLRPEEANWIMPDGSLNKLEREQNGRKLYGHWSTREIELWTLREQASKIIDRDLPKKGRKKGLITTRQADVLLQKSVAKPKKLRSRPTGDIAIARQMQLLKERQERPIERGKTYAPQPRSSNVVSLPQLMRPASEASEKLVKEVPALGLEAPPKSSRTQNHRMRSADFWLQNEGEE